MLIIQDKLVSEDIIEKQFVCNLEACKGACCWEGDFGAPLEKEELNILEQLYPQIKPYLSKEGQSVIEEEGPYSYLEAEEEYATPLLANGACAYLSKGEDGIAKCGIEKAYEEGVIDFKKPISCHLYPIRVTVNKKTDFEALNYDRWDICSAACTKGAQNKVQVYQFVKSALIRKYGEAFFEELAAAANYLGY